MGKRDHNVCIYPITSGILCCGGYHEDFFLGSCGRVVNVVMWVISTRSPGVVATQSGCRYPTLQEQRFGWWGCGVILVWKIFNTAFLWCDFEGVGGMSCELIMAAIVFAL